MKFYYIIIIASLLLLSCSKDVNNNRDVKETSSTPQFSNFLKLNSEESGITFSNNIYENKKFNFLKYEYLYNGGGVAIGDINNDGLLDLYFVGNMTQDKLYLNKGNFTFKDITESSGINNQKGFKTGVSMVDINYDGYLDIYVCRSALSNPELRSNLLYINNKDNTFSEKAKEYGLDDKGYSVQSYFFDANKDGLYEVFVLNHPPNMQNANNLKIKQNTDGTYEPIKLDNYDYISNRYYVFQNDKYKDISYKAGLVDDSFSLSAVVSDFNNDGLQDIYVANDYVKPDRLWINKGNHKYKDELMKYFKHTSFSSMGSDLADLNNDSKLDLMVLDMMASNSKRRHTLNMSQNLKNFKQMERFGFGKQLARNVLQINNYPFEYTDISLMDNLANTDWSWSVLLADFNNDKFKDIHITNGYYRDVSNLDYIDYKSNKLKEKFLAGKINVLEWLSEIPSSPTQNFFFKNKNNLKFENVSKEWNAQTAFSNGAAYGDLNNDGMLDLVVNNINSNAYILKNEMSELSNNFLSIELKSPSNNSITNTYIKAFLNDNTELTEHLNPQRGFLSNSQNRIHFGLGSSKVDSLHIFWSDNTFQKISKPQINSTITITKEINKNKLPIQDKTNTIFEAVELNLNKHKENTNYSEFDYERLIDISYSDQGPASLVLDFNADGLEDLFVGGGKNQAPILYKQQHNKTFKAINIDDFKADRVFEDVEAKIIDANQDKYPDIIVTSASNENDLKPKNYPVRLYIYQPDNETYKRTDFPQIAISSSAILVHDFDQDGLDDIIIAGRNYPKQYPEIPKTYAFKQTSTGFIDNSKKWFKNQSIGMVTDVSLTDLNNDKKPEIIMVGEWMSPKIFSFEQGFRNITSQFNINNLNGLWENILATDVNNDGYQDIILGNRGLNNIFKATSENQLKLVHGDFDNNFKNDYLLFQKEDNNYVPVLGLKRIASQIPSFRKKFNSYEAFAHNNWSSFLNKPNLTTYNVDILEHVILLNQKGKSFKTIPLPQITQSSILKSIKKVIKNNQTLYVLGGNKFNTDAEFSIYDASNGHVLTWDNNALNFNVIPAQETNFNANKDVRKLETIMIGKETYVLVINNNSSINTFLIK